MDTKSISEMLAESESYITDTKSDLKAAKVEHEALDLQLAEALQARAKLVAAFAEQEGLVVPSVPKPNLPQEAEAVAAADKIRDDFLNRINEADFGEAVDVPIGFDVRSVVGKSITKKGFDAAQAILDGPIENGDDS